MIIIINIMIILTCVSRIFSCMPFFQVGNNVLFMLIERIYEFEVPTSDHKMY